MGRLYGACCPGERLELIPMIKMETRHPVEIQFGRELPAICYHCGVLAAWVATIGTFSRHLCVFGKTTPYEEKSSVRKVYIATPIDVVVCKIRENCQTGNRWKRALFTWPKTNIFWLPLKLWLLRESRPKSAMASPQHLADNFPNFIQIGFGGVIAGRVKAVQNAP